MIIRRVTKVVIEVACGCVVGPVVCQTDEIKSFYSKNGVSSKPSASGWLRFNDEALRSKHEASGNGVRG